MSCYVSCLGKACPPYLFNSLNSISSRQGSQATTCEHFLKVVGYVRNRKDEVVDMTVLTTNRYIFREKTWEIQTYHNSRLPAELMECFIKAVGSSLYGGVEDYKAQRNLQKCYYQNCNVRYEGVEVMTCVNTAKEFTDFIRVLHQFKA